MHRIYLRYFFSGKESLDNPNPYQYFDNIGVSLQGFMNAIIWLTTPTLYKAFKQKFVKKFCPCILRHDERIALLPGQDLLEDDEQDIQKLNLALRTNMLLITLFSIRQTVNQIYNT